jgi:16S rRNA (cytosine1402-N4)-methyltransferase
MVSDQFHKPAMAEEAMAYLSPRRGGVYVDCTMGGGGHSKKILEVLGPDGMLIGMDQDPEAIEECARVFQNAPNVKLVHGNFARLGELLGGLGIEEVNGCLFDLGVSSHQLDSIQRGFSFRAEAGLDMRMNVQTDLTAYDLINRLKEKELERILWEYGEERWARRLARRIVERRTERPISTTLELARIAEECVPRVKHKKLLHPATKMFMALRIAVNRELQCLHEGINEAVRVTSDGGRIVVITYHSLEDRIVKNAFREGAKDADAFPGQRQEIPKKKLTILTKKPLQPSEEEVKGNPRARSAKLRAAAVKGRDY